MPIELKMNVKVKKVKTINIWEENMRISLSAMAMNDFFYEINKKVQT